MSFKKEVHLKFFAKYLAQLQPGDIVFTTEDHILSSLIRNIADLPISHCNLYSKPNYLIESSGTVCERYIPDFFHENSFIRMIAFQNPRLTQQQRRAIVKSAESFKGRGYDSMQLMAQGIWALRNRVMPFPEQIELATKRLGVRVTTPVLDTILDFSNNPTETIKRAVTDKVNSRLLAVPPPKHRESLMCSTLIVLSYLNAGVKIDMTNAHYMGTDDLYYYCQKHFVKKYDISFTENGLTFN